MAYKGIDVSTYQGNINWKKVKKDGIKFAMIRGGYWNQKDARFEQNYKNAKAAGVPIGVYHYSYALSVDEAKKEADFCLSYLKGKTLEYPVAFDVEDKTQSVLSTKQLTAIIEAFCDRLESNGYYVMIYSSKSWLSNKLDMSVLKKYDVWCAQWNDKCTYTGNYGMWQYSDKGRVSGIAGNVDLDISYRDYPTLIKKSYLNGNKKKTIFPKKQYYVVKKGDNLTKIAEVYNTTVKQLVKWNKIKDPNVIYVGQKLRVK